MATCAVCREFQAIQSELEGLLAREIAENQWRPSQWSWCQAAAVASARFFNGG